MSGRHRQTPATGARRTLAGTVPVLGLAGVVTAGLGSGLDSTPEAAGTALVTTPIPAPNPVALDQPDLGAGPDVTTVASDASKAAGQAGEQQREQERRSIDAIVDDVQDDARARDAAADQQGRRQLEAFQQDAEKAKKDEDKKRADESDGSDESDGDSMRSCTLSGYPHMSGPTDGDEIVDRDCGMLDMFGGQRSSDPWIDGQLLSAHGDDDD
jgi:hypothetical protein